MTTTIHPLSDTYVRIMADHSAPAIWDISGVAMEYNELPISPDLIYELKEWVKYYNLHNEDWKDEQDRKQDFDYIGFSFRGEELAKRVKAELPEWTVEYFNEHYFKEFLCTDDFELDVQYEII